MGLQDTGTRCCYLTNTGNQLISHKKTPAGAGVTEDQHRCTSTDKQKTGQLYNSLIFLDVAARGDDICLDESTNIGTKMHQKIATQV